MSLLSWRKSHRVIEADPQRHSDGLLLHAQGKAGLSMGHWCVSGSGCEGARMQLSLYDQLLPPPPSKVPDCLPVHLLVPPTHTLTHLLHHNFLWEVGRYLIEARTSTEAATIHLCTLSMWEQRAWGPCHAHNGKMRMGTAKRDPSPHQGVGVLAHL